MSWVKHKKYNAFYVAIEKEVIKVDKYGNETVVPIS